MRVFAAVRCARLAGGGNQRVAAAALSVYLRVQAWLEESLESLDKSLRDMGSRLILRGGGGHVTAETQSTKDVPVHAAGDAASQLALLVQESGATRVFYHRAYTPDGSLEQVNLRTNISCFFSCNGCFRMTLTQRSPRAVCRVWRWLVTFSTSRAWLTWTRATAVGPSRLQPLSPFKCTDCRRPLGDSHAFSPRVRALGSAARSASAAASFPACSIALAGLCSAFLPGTCCSCDDAERGGQPWLGQENHVSLARG